MAFWSPEPQIDLRLWQTLRRRVLIAFQASPELFSPSVERRALGSRLAQTVSTHHQQLIQQASGETWYSVPVCSRGCYYGLRRDRLMRTSIPNNVERGREGGGGW